jgi:hypothetical protein
VIEPTTWEPYADRELEDEHIQQANVRDLPATLAPHGERAARCQRIASDITHVAFLRLL